ncbi:MAG: tetratricopeptide repeat protein [Alphaproteobacteria bacterium]
MIDMNSFSSSELWSWMREFYSRSGPGAWSEGGVPSHITVNPGMADRYSMLAVRFAQDCARLGLISGSEPMRVVELGAGPGVFGFRMAQRLEALRGMVGLEGVRLLQVMSDQAEANVKSWLDHPALAAHIASGALEVAHYDVLGGASLRSRRTGQEIAPVSDSRSDPMFFIANYLFDSLPQDLFRVSEGVVEIGEIALTATDGTPVMVPPEAEEISIHWNWRPVEASACYEDAEFNAVLAEVSGRAGERDHFLFPVGALRCLRHLKALAGGRLLLVIGDIPSGDGFFYREPPQFLDPSAGYFYLPVDMGLVGRFVARLGGWALRPAQEDDGLEISLFSIGLSFADLAETRLAVETHLATFGHSLVDGVIRHMQANAAPPPLPLFLALAAAGRWDPVLLDGSLEFLLTAYRDRSYLPEEWERLAAVLGRFAENVFVTPGATDTYFSIGMLLQEMGAYAEAIGWFQRSVTSFGETVATLYNLAVCHTFTGETDTALGLFHRVVALDPRHVLARGWMAQVTYDAAVQIF